ncbi:hypothetical protein [Qipengyuania seohaensis]|uniref:hypothetical protein n=1 Tax=Qipengyuania seohaensis TaxID=266951 RepID=UPI000C21D646|nr:hypothetical protein [Qipengyuania seohaensis]
MNTRLSFSYQFSRDPNDDFGWLGVKVIGEKFSGEGGFWVQWQDVKEFGEQLTTYPISPEAPLKAAWGYEPWEGDALVVSVEVAPADKRGNLSVQVWLRDNLEMGEGVPQNCVRTTFKTNYPELEAFSQAIARLMDGKVEEASLAGQ